MKTLFITDNCISFAEYKGNNAVITVILGSTKDFMYQAQHEILKIRKRYNVLITDCKDSVILEKFDTIQIKVLSNKVTETQMRRNLVTEQLKAGAFNAMLAEAWIIVHQNDVAKALMKTYFTKGSLINCINQFVRGIKSQALSGILKPEERSLAFKLCKGLQQNSFITKISNQIKEAWKSVKQAEGMPLEMILTPIEELVDSNTITLLKRIK